MAHLTSSWWILALLVLLPALATSAIAAEASGEAATEPNPDPAPITPPFSGNEFVVPQSFLYPMFGPPHPDGPGGPGGPWGPGGPGGPGGPWGPGGPGGPDGPGGPWGPDGPDGPGGPLGPGGPGGPGGGPGGPDGPPRASFAGPFFRPDRLDGSDRPSRPDHPDRPVRPDWPQGSPRDPFASADDGSDGPRRGGPFGFFDPHHPPFGPHPHPRPPFGPHPPVGPHPDSHPHRHPPFPPPPPPPGAIQLTFELLAAVGRAIRVLYGPGAEATGDEHTCGECVTWATEALLNALSKDINSTICAEDAPAAATDPPHRHFCRLFANLTTASAIGIFDQIHINPLSMAVSVCAKFGPCMPKPHPASDPNPEPAAEPEGLIEEDAVSEPGAEADTVEVRVATPSRRLLGHDHARMDMDMGGMHIAMNSIGMLVSSSVPEPSEDASAGASTGATTGATTQGGNGGEAEGKEGEEGGEETCDTCIIEGFHLIEQSVRARIKWICSHAEDEHSPPHIRALCKFIHQYPYLAMVISVIHIKPWEKVVPACFHMGACRPPHPPPHPPHPPHGPCPSGEDCPPPPHRPCPPGEDCPPPPCPPGEDCPPPPPHRPCPPGEDCPPPPCPPGEDCPPPPPHRPCPPGEDCPPPPCPPGEDCPPPPPHRPCPPGEDCPPPRPCPPGQDCPPPPFPPPPCAHTPLPNNAVPLPILPTIDLNIFHPPPPFPPPFAPPFAPPFSPPFRPPFPPHPSGPPPPCSLFGFLRAAGSFLARFLGFPPPPPPPPPPCPGNEPGGLFAKYFLAESHMVGEVAAGESGKGSWEDAVEGVGAVQDGDGLKGVDAENAGVGSVGVVVNVGGFENGSSSRSISGALFARTTSKTPACVMLTWRGGVTLSTGCARIAPLSGTFSKSVERWAVTATVDNQVRRRGGAWPELEQAMVRWIANAGPAGVPLTLQTIRDHVAAMAWNMGIPPTFRYSISWVRRALRRQGVRCRAAQGEAASADMAAVRDAREKLPQLLTHLGLSPRDTFNLDETALWLSVLPRRTYSNGRIPCRKVSKERLIVTFLVNADGSHAFRSLVISKAKRPHDFRSDYDPEALCYWRHNAKGWMTNMPVLTMFPLHDAFTSLPRPQLFTHFISQLNAAMYAENRHIVVLLDNTSSHMLRSEHAWSEIVCGMRTTCMSNVRLVFLPPNTTAFTQPLDQGIIATAKAR
ncbi:unnamed protein product [Closterium sp. NIES-64]|nr:unnamed protein product [Closterium sp. NIES-64]